MSIASDFNRGVNTVPGARAFARLGARTVANDAVAEAPAPVETVTLGKIGDFLELDFGRLFTWLRRGVALSAILAAIGAAAGGAYAVLTPPKYNVATDILIDPTNLQIVNDDLFQQPGAIDSALLNAGSKQRVLTSGNVLARVVEDLDLANDPEFYDPAPGGFSLSALFGGGGKAVGDPKVAAQAALDARVSSKPDDKSFVTTLTVSSESVDKAIRISEAMVEAFKQELASAEAAGAGRTATALNERLNELKADVKAAEEKVEAYKRDNGLTTSSGELVNTTTMAQFNQQVVEAQSRVIAAQAAYDELVAAGPNANSAEMQASATLASLRATVGSLKQQLDSQSMIYGPRHPSIVKLSTELAAANAQLDAEVRRIVGAARVTLEEAKAALAGLEAKAAELRTSVFTDNQALVTLRELERDATSKATIYEAFLSRARQVTEREQLDSTNVRVISQAVPPAARSWPPRTVVMLGVGAVGGFMLGMVLAVVLGAARDLRQPPHRTVAAAA